ncbi:MAG: hypothetical protein ACYC96_05795 [Fimbriimonadaceae bacterium]
MTRDPIERLRYQRGSFVDRPFLSRMTAQEVVDVSIRSYQGLAWTFLRRTVVPTLFCVAAWIFTAHYIGVMFYSKETQPWRQAGELTLKLAMCICVAMPVFLIGVSWIVAIITSLANDWILDRVPNGPAASARALQLLPRMTAAMTREAFLCLGGCVVSLLLLFVSQLIPDTGTNGYSGAIAGVAIIGLIIGCLIALFVFVVHALVPAIIVVEGISASAAAKRSRALLSSVDAKRQNPGQASLILLGMVVVISLGGILAAFGAFEGLASVSDNLKNWMPGTALNALASATWELAPVFLVLWLVLPIWALGTVATYFATRVRVEGYDIDLLAAEVAQQDKRARFEI